MQPCYGIKYDWLVKYYGNLRAFGVGPVESDNKPMFPGENQLSPILDEVGDD